MKMISALSTREKQILEYISMGFTVKEIADNIFLSHHTIITYRRNLLKKLDAKNGADLVRRAFENGELNLLPMSAAS